VLIAQGSLDAALSWAREWGLSATDDLTYLREFEHITLARALVAKSAAERDPATLDEATGLLERLLRAAEEGDRRGSVIEILVLQALALRMREDVRAALPTLESALALAEPEGYVRMFVDEGPAMASLLDAAERQGIAHDYVRRLQNVMSGAVERASVTQGLVDPLSQRELDVLRLLATDLGGPEIARELVLSLNTVRTHTKNIYAKLGVNSRRAAVRRAEELDLMSRSTRR
jgi:LuxR family maltose regulon positive regulatory protein